MTNIKGDSVAIRHRFDVLSLQCWKNVSLLPFVRYGGLARHYCYALVMYECANQAFSNCYSLLLLAGLSYSLSPSL